MGLFELSGFHSGCSLLLPQCPCEVEVARLCPFYSCQHESYRGKPSCGAVSDISRLEPRSPAPSLLPCIGLSENVPPVIMIFPIEEGDLFYACFFKWFPGKF